MSKRPVFATVGGALAITAVITVVIATASGCGAVQRKLTRSAGLPAQTPTAAPARPSSSLPSSSSSSSAAPSAAPPGPPARAQLQDTAAAYTGVYVPGVPGSFAPVDAFASAAGAWPRIVMYYSHWYEKFYTGFADAAYQRHAVVLVQLQPQGTSLARVAAGRDDAYLINYARQVRAFGHAVIIGFGHEMNGGWYDWGAGHVSPAVFVAAWRHVVTVFRSQGALNVTWLWTVNSVNAAPGPLRQWWPGAEWVNWVGIDGYYYRPSDTFASAFGTTIAEVRQFTTAPVLISEVAAGPTRQQVSQITALFAAVRADRLLGLVWFDVTQHAGVYHQDWRLEDSPSALAAFRAGLSSVSGGLHLGHLRSNWYRSCLIIGTLTPCTGYANGAAGDACTTTVDLFRTSINDVIRSEGDPCPADFDAAVSDGATPEALTPADNAGDGANLTSSGYAALARSVTGGPNACSLSPNQYPLPSVP